MTEASFMPLHTDTHTHRYTDIIATYCDRWSYGPAVRKLYLGMQFKMFHNSMTTKEANMNLVFSQLSFNELWLHLLLLSRELLITINECGNVSWIQLCPHSLETNGILINNTISLGMMCMSV